MANPYGRPVDLSATIVRAVIAARATLGWSQRQLAERAGVSPSFVSRFERGIPQAVTLGATQRIFDALGVRATLRTELPIVNRSPPQADSVHAWLCGYAGRRLASAGFEVRHEVEIGTGRFRGWVDVIGYRPADRSLITTEIKSDLPDIGSLQRTTAWYEREAWAAARRFGWRPNFRSWPCWHSTAPRSKSAFGPTDICLEPPFREGRGNWRPGSRHPGTRLPADALR